MSDQSEPEAAICPRCGAVLQREEPVVPVVEAVEYRSPSMLAMVDDDDAA